MSVTEMSAPVAAENVKISTNWVKLLFPDDFCGLAFWNNN